MSPMLRDDGVVVRSDGRKIRLSANNDRKNDRTVATNNKDRRTVRNGNSAGSSSVNSNSNRARNGSSVGSNSANSNNSNSNVASSPIAIAIETGMAGVMTIGTTTATTTGASVTGSGNSNSAPNAIVRTGSDARVTCISDSACSSSNDV